MPIQAVEPRRLYRQIADQLGRLIDDGEYRAGERLPPERTLAETLKVSRPSVREALIALEVEGRVEIRGGSGIYVSERRPAAKAARLVADPGPFEILEARLIVEPEVAALAARNVTPALVARLEESVVGMSRADASRLDGLEHDRNFHAALAEGAGNAALVLVLNTLWDVRVGPLYVQLERHFHAPPVWRKAIDEHRAILAAVAAGDAREARAAMTRHLRNARDRFGSSFKALAGR
jgi:DNA-binding FadR family transcriptional regulator